MTDIAEFSDLFIENNPEIDLSPDSVDGSHLEIIEVSDHQLSFFLDPDRRYWNSLRILLVKFLSFSLTSRIGRERKNSYLNSSLESIGINNFDEYIKGRNTQIFLDDLSAFTSKWEREFGEQLILPLHLESNVQMISSQLHLNSCERSILAFCVLLHSEVILRSFAEEIGSITAITVPRVLAHVLNLPLSDVELAFDSNSIFAKSGVLTVDHVSQGELHTRIDLLTRSFPKRMLKPQKSIISFLNGFINESPPPVVGIEKFDHLSSQADVIKAHITHSIEQKSSGVNILFYGVAGAGKTQFARALAADLGIDLLEICVAGSNQRPMSPYYRIRSYMVGQSLFPNKQCIFLFDECEEIFCNDRFVIESDDDSPAPRKSWLNTLLESNQVPTIWICNSISDFDPAYIRRMDFCINFASPTANQRKEAFRANHGQQLSSGLIDQIARSEHVTHAIMAKTANIIESIKKDTHVGHDVDDVAMDCINQKLKAMGKSLVLKTSNASGYLFDPDLINSPLNLHEVAANLKHQKQARICIYGPAGTGKSAFGGWLSQELDVPHLLFKPSDLLDKYVGESEKRVAEAFAQARSSGAVLQFDEVDSMLQSRSAGMKSWEISLVNEMLTQMESFEGIFIASTNLFDQLDEAALRRFDLNVKFDFLTQAAISKIFGEMCGKLNLGSPTAEAIQCLSSIQNLTPGDFAQILRQHRFNPIKTQMDAAGRLIGAAKLKKSGQSGAGIGFLRAA